MTLRRKHLGRIVVMAAVTLSALAAPAMAAGNSPGADEKMPPYDVSGLKHSKVWVPWIFAFLFGAGAVAVGVKNPHRTGGERT